MPVGTLYSSTIDAYDGGVNETSKRRGIVTLREVAAEAGVSVSTASRALTGRRRVRPEVSDRVHDAAERLGYRPNEAARSLRMSRSLTLGAVFPTLESPVALDLIDGLVAGSHDRGYSLLITSARGQADLYRLHVQRFFERRADALLLASPDGNEGDLSQLEQAGIPVLALVTRGAGSQDLPLLTVDERPAVREAVERLIELGHRSIGLLVRNPGMIGPRRQAAQQVAEQRGAQVVVAGYGEHDSAEEVGAALGRLRGGPSPVTALLAPYRLLPQVLSALRALGLQIPDDLSLITFTDSRWTEGIAWPPVAAIHTDTFELGSTAARLLVDVVENDQPLTPQQITALNLATWEERPSVGPAPRAAS